MPDNQVLAEAVHTRKPHCRAYKILENLAGMRGIEVFKYIDKNCQIIYPVKDEDEYMDEEQFVIQRIEFEQTPSEFMATYKKMPSVVKGEKKSAAPVVVKKKEEIKISKEDIEKVRPLFRRMMKGCLARRRFKASLQEKKCEIIAKFPLTGELSQLFIFVQSQMTAFNMEIYKVIIFNTLNKVRRHDTQYLTLEHLPGGFSRSKKASAAEMKAVFSQWINIQWVPNSNPRLISRITIQDPNPPQIGEEPALLRDASRSFKTEKSSKKNKKNKKTRKSKKKKRHSDSDSASSSSPSSSSSETDEETRAIDEDVKVVKSFVKKLRKKVLAFEDVR